MIGRQYKLNLVMQLDLLASSTDVDKSAREAIVEINVFGTCHVVSLLIMAPRSCMIELITRTLLLKI